MEEYNPLLVTVLRTDDFLSAVADPKGFGDVADIGGYPPLDLLIDEALDITPKGFGADAELLLADFSAVDD